MKTVISSCILFSFCTISTVDAGPCRRGGFGDAIGEAMGEAIGQGISDCLLLPFDVLSGVRKTNPKATKPVTPSATSPTPPTFCLCVLD